MYSGLELLIVVYIVVFVIHIGMFRFFTSLYKFVDDVGMLKPTGFCFAWPLGWVLFSLYGLCQLAILIYYVVYYLITGQWEY